MAKHTSIFIGEFEKTAHSEREARRGDAEFYFVRYAIKSL